MADGYPQDNRDPYSYGGRNGSPDRWKQQSSRIPQDRGKATQGKDLRSYVGNGPKSPAKGGK